MADLEKALRRTVNGIPTLPLLSRYPSAPRRRSIANFRGTWLRGEGSSVVQKTNIPTILKKIRGGKRPDFVFLPARLFHKQARAEAIIYL